MWMVASTHTTHVGALCMCSILWCGEQRAAFSIPKKSCVTTAYAYYPMYERLNMMRADTGLKMCLSVCAYHIPSKNRISCILSPQPFYARRLIANKIYILSYMSTALRSPSRSTRVHARIAYTNTHTHTFTQRHNNTHTLATAYTETQPKSTLAAIASRHHACVRWLSACCGDYVYTSRTHLVISVYVLTAHTIHCRAVICRLHCFHFSSVEVTEDEGCVCCCPVFTRNPYCVCL